jgi:hypothetical protein
MKRSNASHKILRRLQNELEHLTNILDSLTNVTNPEESVPKLLRGPIERCSQVCREMV